MWLLLHEVKERRNGGRDEETIDGDSGGEKHGIDVETIGSNDGTDVTVG